MKEENGMTSGPMFWVLYIVLLGGMLYFMAIRPQKKEKQRQKELLESVAVGDTILTSSGFYGVIIDMIQSLWNSVTIRTAVFLCRRLPLSRLKNRKPKRRETRGLVPGF